MRTTSCHCCCCCWKMRRTRRRTAIVASSFSCSPSCSPSWARATAKPSSSWTSCHPSSQRVLPRSPPPLASAPRGEARALAPGMDSACSPTRISSWTAFRASTACSPCSQQLWIGAPRPTGLLPEAARLPGLRSCRSRLARLPGLHPDRRDRCSPCGTERSPDYLRALDVSSRRAAAHPARPCRPCRPCRGTSISSALGAIESVIDIAAAREIGCGPSWQVEISAPVEVSRLARFGQCELGKLIRTFRICQREPDLRWGARHSRERG